ncbi:MAG: SDR family NAD(P)-dependent oxidoreductase [Candidatus Pelagadaptatus aseana]|uniref:SDR family NAD(P)-dependent oxidoreductase n=1 Tax=Candidatus Pelagadaptatus aseana TaxID=3120508 RepID=UPI0039B34C74
MKNFNDKVVVITGAASGMGRAYALAFATLGSRLALCDLELDALEETMGLVRDISEKQHLLEAFDISERDAVNRFAATVEAELGPADILINNAGIEGSGKPAWMTSAECYQRVMAVNYFGVVNGCCAFLPSMRQRNQGVIVNVSSVFGLAGMPSNTDYCSSKFAVRGFTEALMAELVATGIQVHSVHPGGINTNITRQQHTQKFSQQYLKTSPDDFAQHVIQCIKKNKARVIYGYGARKIVWGSRLLSLPGFCRAAWRELQQMVDMGDYRR